MTYSYLWRKSKLLILFISCTSSVLAQRVHHLDVNNGLCTNSLTDLTVDRNGSLWIGSYNGLMHYSGTHTKCIKQIGSDNKSLSAIEMHSIAEDQCGFIWVGTTAGLDRVNPVTFEIEHFSLKSPNPQSSHIGYIYSVYADKHDFLWISTDAALFKFDIITGSHVAIPEDKNQHSVPSRYLSYNGFVETEKGIWLHTMNGMAFFEFAKQIFSHKYHNPDSISVFKLKGSGDGSQSDMTLDANGNLWFVYKHKLLARYHIEKDQLDTFRFVPPANTWNCCKSIEVDPHDNIWIGLRHGGVMIFDTDTETFQLLKREDSNRPVKSDYVYSIERGHDGKMFVSHDNGLDVIDMYDLSLKERSISDRFDFQNLKYPSGEIVFDEQEESVFIPFYNYGFFRYYIAKDSFAEFNLAGLRHATSAIHVQDGSTFMATEGNLKEIRLINDTITVLDRVLLPDTVESKGGQVICYYTGVDNSAFIKNNRGSIFYFKNDRLTVLNGAGFKPLMCVSEDKEFFNFLNDDLNIIRLNIRQDKYDTIGIQKLLKEIKFQFSLPRHMVDDGETIWMTSQNGILRYDLAEKKLRYYNQDQGLSHNFTFSIVLDKNKKVWVGSLGGIDMYDKHTDRFISVYTLKDNAYMSAFGHAIRSDKGELFFQFGNKLLKVNPATVSNMLPENLKIRLNEVLVNGKNIDWTTNKILNNLAHTQNRLTFIFDVLFNDDADLVTFEYRLDNNSWIDNEGRNDIHLASLSPGTYNLELRGSLGSPTQDTHVISIPFRIHPPWWKQWWFYALLFISTATALWLYFKGRINKYRQELLIARQITDLEAKALRAQMNPHFVFNSLNAIQECIVTGRVDEAYTYLTKFSRLLRLVLEHSDIGEVTLHEELEVLDLYISLEKLRFKNDMHYQFELGNELDPEEIWMPPMLIQPHIENSIWHGLRHKEGEKNLTLSIKETIPDYLEVIIQDDGIGRKKAASIKQNRLGGTNHQSKGKQLSENRMELLRKTYPHASMTIVDLYHDDGEAAGTKVVLMIPMVKKIV